MFGEKPVRQSATPISSAIDTKRFLKISNSIGLMTAGSARCGPHAIAPRAFTAGSRLMGEDQVPQSIHSGSPLLRHESRGSLVDGERWAGEHVARFEGGPIEDEGGTKPAGGEQRPLGDRSRAATRAWSDAGEQSRFLGQA